MEIAVLPISIPAILATLALWIKGHSRNTVSYPKSLRIQAFESLDAFNMYYAIGASVLSLGPYIRESTDSLIPNVNVLLSCSQSY